MQHAYYIAYWLITSVTANVIYSLQWHDDGHLVCSN